MKDKSLQTFGLIDSRSRLTALLTALLIAALLTLAACGSPSGGEVIGSVEDLPANTNPDGTVDEDIVTDGKIVLPTDTLLNLYCVDVGIAAEPCILEDPENPYRQTATPEFDVNNPDAETKFDLANQIPAGPTGAKARFYLWATAQARFPRGENQYYTALALHELYTAARDPIVRDQALTAYRSTWDNYFGSVTVFECCGEFFPDPDRGDTAFSFPLNELVLEQLVRAQETPDAAYPGGYYPLIPDDPSDIINDAGLLELETAEVILDWGYVYRCADDVCFVSVAEF
jgi:hypothetical protein